MQERQIDLSRLRLLREADFQEELWFLITVGLEGLSKLTARTATHWRAV